MYYGWPMKTFFTALIFSIICIGGVSWGQVHPKNDGPIKIIIKIHPSDLNPDGLVESIELVQDTMLEDRILIVHKNPNGKVVKKTINLIDYVITKDGYSITTGDFNHDGKFDLAVTYHTSKVGYDYSTKTFIEGNEVITSYYKNKGGTFVFSLPGLKEDFSDLSEPKL